MVRTVVSFSRPLIQASRGVHALASSYLSELGVLTGGESPVNPEGGGVMRRSLASLALVLLFAGCAGADEVGGPSASEIGRGGRRLPSVRGRAR